MVLDDSFEDAVDAVMRSIPIGEDREELELTARILVAVIREALYKKEDDYLYSDVCYRHCKALGIDRQKLLQAYEARDSSSELPKKIFKRPKMTDEQAAKICSLYKKGYTIQQLSGFFGFTARTITAKLRANDVVIGRGRHKMSKLMHKESKISLDTKR